MNSGRPWPHRYALKLTIDLSALIIVLIPIQIFRHATLLTGTPGPCVNICTRFRKKYCNLTPLQVSQYIFASRDLSEVTYSRSTNFQSQWNGCFILYISSNFHHHTWFLIIRFAITTLILVRLHHKRTHVCNIRIAGLGSFLASQRHRFISKESWIVAGHGRRRYALKLTIDLSALIIVLNTYPEFSAMLLYWQAPLGRVLIFARGSEKILQSHTTAGISVHLCQLWPVRGHL